MLLEQLARNCLSTWDSGDLARAIREMGEYLKEVDAERQRHESTIEVARGDYEEPSGGEIEIDDDPLLSVGEDGMWVSAWVWVPIEADAEEPAEGTPGDSREDEDSGLPKPPPGYTAEELDRDNPYNQWMHE